MMIIIIIIIIIIIFFIHVLAQQPRASCRDNTGT